MSRSLGIVAPLAPLARRWATLRDRYDPPPKSAWVGLFLCACASMLIGAAAGWRVRCDGASCAGVNALWAAWSIALAAVVISGVMLRARLKAEARPIRWVNLGVGAMLLLALWLAGYWLGHAR